MLTEKLSTSLENKNTTCLENAVLTRHRRRRRKRRRRFSTAASLSQQDTWTLDPKSSLEVLNIRFTLLPSDFPSVEIIPEATTSARLRRTKKRRRRASTIPTVPTITENPYTSFYNLSGVEVTLLLPQGFMLTLRDGKYSYTVCLYSIKYWLVSYC